MWYQACQNPEAIGSLYSNSPELNPLSVHDLSLSRNGPTLTVRADLPVFPDHPPSRWIKETNTVQVTLDLFGVSKFEQRGWGTHIRGMILLTRLDEGELLFSFESEVVKINATCGFARIARLSPYVNGAAP